MEWHNGLTERQRRFCEAFAANGGNAYQAARSAGYKHPQQAGAENMEKPGIRNALESLRLATTNEAIMTREERQKWWTNIIRDETRDIRDRLRASELLGKSQGDFLDRVKHEGVIGLCAVVVPLKDIGGDVADKQ